jgi:hypothetical protein
VFWAKGGTWVMYSALPGLGIRLGLGLIIPLVSVLFCYALISARVLD